MFERELANERHKSSIQVSDFLKSAFVADVTVCVLFFFVFPADSSQDNLSVYDETRIALLNSLLFGYPVAAFILWFSKETLIVESFPRWLSVSVLGSIFAAFLIGFTAEAADLLPIIHFQGRFLLIAFGSVFLTLYTIPFTAFFYHLPALKRLIKSFL